MPVEVPSLSVPTSNGDLVATAEHTLITQRDKAKAALDALNAAIDSLRALRATNGHREYPPVGPEEYKGKRAIDALELYLRVRRGAKVTLSQAVEDLVKGGAYPGDPRKGQSDPTALIMHTLKIGIPQKSRIFEFEPKLPAKNHKFKFPRKISNDLCFVWLGPGADVPKKRARS